MTRRYFYDDPLAAAWMAMRHGMLYVNDLPAGIGHCFQIISAAPLHDIWSQTKFTLMPNRRACGGRFYIHTDCLLLLEPQDGDVIRGSCGGELFNVRDTLTPEFHGDCTIRFAEELIRQTDFKIIQRECVAFIWPESSDA